MPRMGGPELLDEIRADDALRKTPVCIVTTSEFHLDIEKAYDQMVSGFLSNPTRQMKWSKFSRRYPNVGMPAFTQIELS